MVPLSESTGLTLNLILIYKSYSSNVVLFGFEGLSHHPNL